MEKRLASEAETRRRIVEATVRLHAERGIIATKPADVAARANVALTTFYKHFPSRGELVQACTSYAGSLVRPPDPAQVATFRPVEIRVATMVESLFAFYEAREPFLYAGRTEERNVPELQPVMQRLRTLRDSFVDAALSGDSPSAETRAIVTTLVDFWAWRTLSRELGLPQAQAVRSVTTAVRRIIEASPRQAKASQKGKIIR
jgi:AcrR family transcriptional regulator